MKRKTNPRLGSGGSQRPNVAAINRRSDGKAQERQDHVAWYELERQKGVVRDRVRDVAARRHTSAYIFGPRGTSKTFIVRRTLDDLGEPYQYHAGHLTPLGFFDLIAEYP